MFQLDCSCSCTQCKEINSGSKKTCFGFCRLQPDSSHHYGMIQKRPGSWTRQRWVFLQRDHFKEFILVFHKEALMLAVEHPGFVAFQLCHTRDWETNHKSSAQQRSPPGKGQDTQCGFVAIRRQELVFAIPRAGGLQKQKPQDKWSYLGTKRVVLYVVFQKITPHMILCCPQRMRGKEAIINWPD